MMPNNRNDEERIEQLMKEIPLSMQTPNELKSKLIDNAVAAKAKARPVRRPIWVAVMTVGIAALALGSYFFNPRPAMSKTWTMVREAVDKVTSFKMTVTDITGGERKQDAVITLSAQGVLISADKGEIIYINDKAMQIYDPEENTVVRMKVNGFEANIKDALKEGLADGLKEINLKDMIADMEKEYGKENIKVGQVHNDGGRQFYDVYMRDPKDGSQGTITVDAASDRPIKIVSEEVENGAKKINEITLDYNGSYDLKPNFPADAKYQDIDLTGMMKEGMGKGFEEAAKHGGSFHFDFSDDKDKK